MTTTVRLSRDEAREVFRTMLAATGRPGRWYPLPQLAEVEPVLLPALALADLDTGVFVVGDDEHHGDLLATSTGARLTDDLDRADMVVALTPPGADQVSSLRRGTTAAPELGARLFVAVGRDGDPVDVTVSGPGCTAGRRFTLKGISRASIGAIAEANAEFPAGIDTWFVSPDGGIVAVPRSSTITIEGDAP